MYQIEMTDENILVQKVEAKAESEFVLAGDADKRGAIYCIKHAPGDSPFAKDDLVLLKPGQYPGFYYDNEAYTVVQEDDIMAELTEIKA